MTRFALAVVAVPAVVLSLAACFGAPEPHWRNTGESAIHELEVPSKEYETEVHGPMPWEEATDHADEMAKDGWMLIDSRSAAPDFPTKVVLTYRRHP